MIEIRNQILVILAVVSIAAVSTADEFHYNNILIGDRAAGMGGAYTAVSDDPGGMYYNPAGIAYSAGKNLSASVNAYSVSNRSYEGVMNGKAWTRTSSTLLPNFFGIIQPIGKFKFGFSYAVPDSNQEDQDQTFYDDSTVINFNNNNNTSLFGPSAAMQLNDSCSVGATLYVHKRNTHAILNASNVTAGKIDNWSNGYTESDEWGLKPVLGVMWSPMDKLSVGATVSKTFVLTSDILAQSSSYTDPLSINPKNSRTYETFDYKRKYPFQLTVGAAYFLNSSLLVSGDLSYNSSADYAWVPINGVQNIEKRNSVVNGALGAEYYLDKNWAVRGGLFTDYANTPKVVVGGTNQKEHIDMFGGSMTVSHFSKNTSISAGGSFKYGSGKSQVLGGTSDIQNATANTWTMFVSSSYSY